MPACDGPDVMAGARAVARRRGVSIHRRPEPPVVERRPASVSGARRPCWQAARI